MKNATLLSRVLANRWSLLILGEACRGTTRFKQFQEQLGVAPKSLVQGLSTLVELGLLRRQCYGESPARCDYLLTEAGETIRPALASLSAWGQATRSCAV